MAPRVPVLSKLQTEDADLNRIQDQYLGALNPVLRDLKRATLVTGSKGGNAAVASLIKALASIGLITDGTT